MCSCFCDVNVGVRVHFSDGGLSRPPEKYFDSARKTAYLISDLAPGADCNFAAPKSRGMPDALCYPHFYSFYPPFLPPPPDYRPGRCAPSVPLAIRHCSLITKLFYILPLFDVFFTFSHGRFTGGGLNADRAE